MLFNCRGQSSHGNISLNAQSHSSYNHSYQIGHGRGNFLTSCMQVVCGLDADTTSTRQYSNTMDDNSSITNIAYRLEDECRITLSRFTKRVNGRDVRYIQAQALLHDDKVDEAHDLLYLVQMPEYSNAASPHQHSPDTQTRKQQYQQSSAQQVERRSSASVMFQSSDAKPLRVGVGATGPYSHVIDDAEESNSGLIEVKKHQKLFQQLNVHQKGVAGAYMVGQNDFVNQHTGSFTFHPQYDENGRSLSGTRNSSQPILEIPRGTDADDTAAGPGHIAVHAQQDRCDTETYRQCDRAGEIPYANMLLGASSDNSSQLLLEKSSGGIAKSPGKRLTPRLPRTYGDLDANFTVQVKKDRKNRLQNRAIGDFPLNKVPDGWYRIYYFRPKNRSKFLAGAQSNSCSARDRIQIVGKGHDFYIFDKNSSQSPSKQGSLHFQESSFDQQQQQHQSHPQRSALQSKASPGTVSSKCCRGTPYYNENSLTYPQQQQQQQVTTGGSKRAQKSAPSFFQTQQTSQKSSKEKTSTTNKKVMSKNQRLTGDLQINTRVSNQQKQVVGSGQAEAEGVFTPVLSKKNPYLPETASISPEEVDALVCHPDSQETDLVSKDSFNTDKVRQENLQQNLAVASGGLRSSQYADEEAAAHCMSSGLGSAGVLTFGANSAMGAHRVASSSSQQNRLVASDTLTGLQEIYSVHQINLGGGSQEDTLKAGSVVTYADGGESPDTPNLYQNLSVESHHTASQVEQHSLSGDVVSMMQPKFAADSSSQLMNPEESKTGESKFMLRLNAIGCAKESQSFESESGKESGAIRVEKQASYTKSASESSCSGGGQASNSKREISIITGGESESFGITSAFAAAEIKVRKSHLQMFNSGNSISQIESLANNSHGMGDSVDIVVSEKAAFHDTQGPPIILPQQQSQSVHEMINEMVLTPVLDRQQQKEFSVVNEEVEQKQISFLQQLIDTRGPNEGSNLITVMPLAGHNDQLMMTQWGYGGASQKAQKHSRAIAFSDGGEPVGIEQPILSPVWIEGEPLNSTLAEQSSQEQSFHSPSKAAYCDMIQQNIMQNNSNTLGYEQMTRNQHVNQARNYQTAGVNLGYSDRKQLSTVDEENVSQCSDFTSLHQHHSRFMQTQQSSISRKSLQRSSMPALDIHQNTHKVPDPFRIQEEPSEVDVGERNPAFEISNVEAQNLFGKPKVFSTEAGGGEEASQAEDDTGEKVKIMLFPSQNNMSATSTKACSKQPSQAALSNFHGTTNSSDVRMPITSRSSAQKQVPLSQQLSDYYQRGKVSGIGEDSSSSLLDLDHNDFNATSELLSPDARNYKQQLRAQATVVDLNICDQLPYQVGSPQDDSAAGVLGNFKSKKSNVGNADATFSSGEGAQSQESQLLDSVHLNCSENLNDEAGSASKYDSVTIIQLIEKAASCSVEEQASTQRPSQDFSQQQTPSVSETNKFVPLQTSSSKTALKLQQNTSLKQGSSRRNSGKLQGSERKRVAPFRTKQGPKGSLTMSHASTLKENLGGATSSVSATPLASSLTDTTQRQSLKQLTPILNSSQNKQHPIKLHMSVQKHMTPQLFSSAKTKKVGELVVSERKLNFNPAKTGSSSTVLLPASLSKKLSLCGSNGPNQTPPQPLLKHRELFVGKTGSTSQFLQATQAQLKTSHKRSTNQISTKKSQGGACKQTSNTSGSHAIKLAKLLTPNTRQK